MAEPVNGESLQVNILVVGGGDENTLSSWKLRQSSRVEDLFCAPGNAGTAALGTNVPILPNDFEGLADFARKQRIGLTVVGPDDPLALGIVDEFQNAICEFSARQRRRPASNLRRFSRNN